MRRTEEVLKIKTLKSLRAKNNRLYNVFGIYLSGSGIQYPKWRLADETDHEGYDLIISRPDSLPAMPIKGDIIRIHRIRFNERLDRFESTTPKNIVIWSAFKEKPLSQTSARKISNEIEDQEIRKNLELEFYHTIPKIQNIFIDQVISRYYVDLACRVVANYENYDKYGNVVLRLVDGTLSPQPIRSNLIVSDSPPFQQNIKDNSILVLIYSKQTLDDVDTHHKIASDLKPGDYVFLSNVEYKRLADGSSSFKLSANLKNSKCIRPVEPNSIAGLRIAEACAKNLPQLNKDINIERTHCNLTTPPAPQTKKARVTQDLTVATTTNTTTTSISTSVAPVKVFASQVKQNQIKKLDALAPSRGTYNYANMVVRIVVSKALPPYNNHLLLVEDGSQTDYKFCYTEELASNSNNNITFENKASILVYSPNRPQDSDRHIEVARSLLPGDHAYIENAKVSWSGVYLKIELNANENFGRKLVKLDESDALVEQLALSPAHHFSGELMFEESNEKPSQLGPIEDS